MQLDQHGGCTIAAPQARDRLHLDPGFAPQLAGNRLERRKAAGRAPKVAGDVPADVNLDIRRRLRPEMREEADDLMDTVQRHIEAGREPLDLFAWQVAHTLLDGTKLPDEHQISRLMG